MNNFITEISWEDFQKINPTLYRHTKVEEANCHKFVFQPIQANDYIKGVLKYYEDNKDNEKPLKSLILAIHEEPTKEDIEKIKQNEYTSDGNGGSRLVNDEEAFQSALRFNCYLDKYMNQFTGMQTFQTAENQDEEHIYSTRDYWELHSDYWKVRKCETKAIYLIRF